MFIKTFHFKRIKSLPVFLVIPLLFFSCGQKAFDPNKPLVKIDKDKLIGWEVKKKKGSDSYKVIKTNEGWKVELPGGQAVDPSLSFIDRSIRHLADMKPIKFIDTAKDKWDAMGVGDTGTVVTIFQEGGDTQHLIVGKLDFMNTSKANYYVRVPGDDRVYVIQKYLEGSFVAPLSSMRAKDMVPFPPQAIAEIHLLSAAGRQTTLATKDGQWQINGKPADPAKVIRYINVVTHLEALEFLERPNNGADLSVIVTPVQGESATLKIYRLDEGGWALESSLNKGNFMKLSPQVFMLLFPDDSYFLPVQSSKGK